MLEVDTINMSALREKVKLGGRAGKEGGEGRRERETM